MNFPQALQIYKNIVKKKTAESPTVLCRNNLVKRIVKIYEETGYYSLSAKMPNKQVNM